MKQLNTFMERLLHFIELNAFMVKLLGYISIAAQQK